MDRFTTYGDWATANRVKTTTTVLTRRRLARLAAHPPARRLLERAGLARVTDIKDTYRFHFSFGPAANLAARCDEEVVAAAARRVRERFGVALSSAASHEQPYSDHLGPHIAT